MGGRTQIWQNGSEVHIFPLRCVSVSVRTRPTVSQPFSVFQLVGLHQTMASSWSGGRLYCVKHAQVYEMGASIIHEENKYFR